MFESHLAGSALDGTPGLGQDPAGAEEADWMVRTVQEAGGALRQLTSAGIEHMTGVPGAELPSPQDAQVPGPGINQLPGQVPPNQLPAVDPNMVMVRPPPVRNNMNRILLVGGIAAAGIVGWMWYTGRLGGRKRR